jgi:hypothetical protein
VHVLGIVASEIDLLVGDRDKVAAMIADGDALEVFRDVDVMGLPTIVASENSAGR